MDMVEEKVTKVDTKMYKGRSKEVHKVKDDVCQVGIFISMYSSFSQWPILTKKGGEFLGVWMMSGCLKVILDVANEIIMPKQVLKVQKV